jgi:thioesterase domain-containing protein
LAVHDLREAAAEPPETLAEPARATVSFLDIYKVAHREHRPNGLLQRGHVVLYRASKGNDAPDDMPFFEQFSDCALGWGARVMEPIDILPVPGGHVSALQEPHVAVLAQAVQDGIDRAITRGEAQTSSERRDAHPDRALPPLVEDMVRC